MLYGILKEIKSLLLHQGMTMTELVDELNNSHKREEAQSNFHRKLSKETIKFTEIKDIADVLGYDLVWVPKGQKIDTIHTGVVYSPRKNGFVNLLDQFRTGEQRAEKQRREVEATKQQETTDE